MHELKLSLTFIIPFIFILVVRALVIKSLIFLPTLSITASPGVSADKSEGSSDIGNIVREYKMGSIFSTTVANSPYISVARGPALSRFYCRFPECTRTTGWMKAIRLALGSCTSMTSTQTITRNICTAPFPRSHCSFQRNITNLERKTR